MAQAGTAYVDVRANLTAFNRQMNEQMSQRRMGRLGAVGGAALGVGLGAAVAKAFQGTVGAAAQFESAFAEVRKTVDTNAVGFARLERGIRRMARQVPTSADELSALAGEAGALGIRSRDLLRFTRTAAELGIATDLSSSSAANALARLSNIMGTSSRDFRRLGSTLVQLGNDGASTEAEISEMALRIAGAGKQIGLTEAQVLAFASALSSVGIEAEAGGSAISRVFITLATASRQGGRELATIARIAGTSARGFSRAFRQDAAGATLRFITGLDRLRRSGGDVFGTLEDLRLSEIRVRDALLRASAAGRLFNDQLATGNEGWRENNALTREANARYETAAARYQRLRNQLRDFGISVGQDVLPKLTALGDILSNDRLTGGEKFERLSREIGRLVGDGVEFAAEAAAEGGPRIALALATGLSQAWQQMNPLGKLFTAAAIIRLVGGRGALLGAGASIGRTLGTGVSAGMASTAAGGAVAGGARAGLGGLAAGAAGGYLAGARPGLAGQRIYGQGFRYGAPVSQLGPRGLGASASGMMASLRSSVMPVAKRVGLAGVGIVLADQVISEFGRRAQERSDDLLESLSAKTGRTGLQRLNIMGRLPGSVGDAFRPDNPAESVLPILRQVYATRTLLSQREIGDLAAKRSQLNLTREQRVQYDRILALLRIGSRIRFRVDANMDPRALRQVQNNFRALRSGALSNLRDILSVSRRNMDLIGQVWGRGTMEGRRAAARNMRATADAIATQMRRSGRVTNEGVQSIVRLLRDADLTDPSRRMARSFGREWARGMDTSKEITRRGLRRMLAEAQRMPGPMRKVALETWLAQLDAARKNRKITEDQFRNLRSRVTSEFTGINTASRRSARIVPENVLSMASAATGGLEVLAGNANRTLTAFGARPLAFGFQKVRAQRRQRGGRITPVPGVGSGDKVPAMLEPGEVVINREAVRAMGGAQHVNRINQIVPRFQEGGIVGRIRDAMGALPGLDALATILGQRFGLGVTSGLRPGAITTSGNPSDHGWGGAIDVSNGIATPQMDAAHAWMSRFMAPAIKQMLYRTMTGGDHFNHIHVALLPQFANNPEAVLALAGAMDIPTVEMTGPDGPLRSMGQGALDRVRSAAKAAVRRAFDSMAPVMGVGGSDAYSASGNGADLMRQISRQRGWNFADWWELDRRETGHGADIFNESSGAFNRAQFLDMNRGKYGPGSLPGASMPEQIMSMAAYIAERYGNPTAARAFHDSHNWYATGGIVGRRAVTRNSGGPRFGRVGEPSLLGLSGLIRRFAQGVRRPLGRSQARRALRRAMRLISGIGLPADQQQALTDLSNQADTFAEWAARAGALSYEMVYAGGEPVIGPDGRQLIDEQGRPMVHEPGDPILDAERRPMTFFGAVNGRTEAGWTNERLGHLFALRNKLVQGAGVVGGEQIRVARLIDLTRRRLADVKRLIARWARRRREIIAEARRTERRVERLERQIEDARRRLQDERDDLERLRDRPRRNASRIAASQRRIGELVDRIGGWRNELVTERDRLGALRGESFQIRQDQTGRVRVRGQLEKVLGDDSSGLLGRQAAMREYLPNLLGSGGDSFKGLVTVQGMGGPMEVLGGLPPVGVLGGEIFDAQEILRQLAVRPTPVPAPDPTTAEPDDSERTQLLQQLLEESQRRLAVSQAQYPVFADFARQFPLAGLPGFGGSFATGGVVPGSVGEARTIIAHGGERVLSVDEQRRAGVAPAPVQVNVRLVVERGAGVDPSKMRVLVEDTMRNAARVGARRVPGLASMR